MDAVAQYKQMKAKAGGGKWAQRILSQLGYLMQVFGEEPLPEKLCGEIKNLYERYLDQGTITREDALRTEEALREYSPRAKSFRVLCAAHAHIDMNWMWGLPETSSVVIDTFQTMLDLMEEYPDFIFSQSQASTYEIIEKYCPSLLPQIKKRVQEGRWEVTASTWVELDKNMSGTEAMARHILYTKNYMARLFDLRPEEIELDFEPDTFGHSQNVPEILSQGGVKYYYHCRGFEEKSIYRWQAPSGASVLVFREPDWYLGPITYDMMLGVPAYCRENHTDITMKVYGVGDHGGGPTRRDIERIREMASWPLMPDIKFGRMHDFFHELEKNIDAYPVVNHELNFVFTGCYTSQSRIKMANRVGEDRLYDSEALGALALSQGADSIHTAGYAQAWKKILFNQFHDILPGSGVTDTRECGMGNFQEALSYAGANANRAMKAIGGMIDTASLGGETPADSTAEGAGVGYNIAEDARVYAPGASEQYGFTHAARGGGPVRAFTVFNTLPYHRFDTVTLTLWDWDYPLEELRIFSPTGDPVDYLLLEKEQTYWQHRYTKLCFPAEVPSLGYATYVVRRTDLPEKAPKNTDPRVHSMEDGEILLENDLVRAAFDSATMRLVSLREKGSGKELVMPGAAAFRYIEESDQNGMSAWITGNYGKVVDINEAAFVKVKSQRTEGIRQEISYEMAYASSVIRVRVTLDQGSRMLRFNVTADWHEVGHAGGVTPQLQFFLPFNYEAQSFRYDVPAGYVDRPSLGHDVPAILYAAAVPAEGGPAVMLTSDCKYGYRGHGSTLILNLLRSSYEPDPYPELGVHHMEIGVAACESACACGLQREALQLAHPLLPYSNSLHTGSLPLRQSFLAVDGDVRVAALKPAEDGKGMVVRLCADKETEVTLRPYQAAEDAVYVDLLERETGSAEIAEGAVKVRLPKNSMRTLKIRAK